MKRDFRRVGHVDAHYLHNARSLHIHCTLFTHFLHNARSPHILYTFLTHLSPSRDMRLYARNTILEQENEEQKIVLQNRKRYLSEKKRAIEGKHLMTAEELRKVRERK